MSDHLAFINAQKSSAMVNIETSTRCTLRCPQCARAKLNSPKDSSTYKAIKQRISNGFDIPINDVEKLLKFFEFGVILCGSISDPVYWPNLLNFLDISKNYPNHKISIHTAASQQNIYWYKKAFEASGKNITWKFGLDGMGDTSMIYRIGQNSKLLFDAMLLGKQMGINLEWHFIVFNYNLHQIDQAKKFAKNHYIDLFFIKTDRPLDGGPVPIKWQPKHNKEIVNYEN